jgi:hypothetical protein
VLTAAFFKGKLISGGPASNVDSRLGLVQNRMALIPKVKGLERSISFLGSVKGNGTYP